MTKSKKRILKVRSVTFTAEQTAWLEARIRPGEAFTAAVRECVQAIMDGAVQPCATAHCYKRGK